MIEELKELVSCVLSGVNLPQKVSKIIALTVLTVYKKKG